MTSRSKLTIKGVQPLETNVPLSVELKYKTRFESISFFRDEPTEFPIERALQEYHREPIAYALALAELNTDVYRATRRRNQSALISYVNTLRSERRNRDILGHEDYHSGIFGLTVRQILRYWKTEFLMLLLDSPLGYRREPTNLGFQTESLRAWKKQFNNFVTNVNFFCQHTGSEVDDLAPSRETVNNLREFASDRRQELAPLLEVNARLNQELMSYKRINAALQTRHTIEKLTFELPDTEQYRLSGSGPKWQALWDQIWTDASRNVENPFHDLWTQSTGSHARDNIRDKGRSLFADMSGEIHGYDRRQFDYEHFDASARKVAMILHENPKVDEKTEDVAWEKEIRKYPIAWPDANNLGLTLLQRLKGRVTDSERQFNDAKEEVERLQDTIDAGEELGLHRKKNKEVNEAAQNRFEEDGGLGLLDAINGSDGIDSGTKVG